MLGVIGNAYRGGVGVDGNPFVVFDVTQILRNILNFLVMNLLFGFKYKIYLSRL